MRNASNLAPCLYPPEIVRGDDAWWRPNFVLVCEHASNHFPPEFGALGLDLAAQISHAAWDPGALGVAREMRRILDADLVAGSVSRLLYDCNRPPDAPSAIPDQSEVYAVPGNQGLSAAQREYRIRSIYDPFHGALKDILDERGLGVIVTIHSFTPVYHDIPRSCEIGILHDDADARLAEAVMMTIPTGFPFKVERDKPYSASDGVTHTLKEHGFGRCWPSVMIEIRNDLIDSPQRQAHMARHLVSLLLKAVAEMRAAAHA